MTNEVQNVHEDKSELQIKLEKKIDGLRQFLGEEPEAVLMPVLVGNEQEVRPNVRLILKEMIKQKEDESNTGDAGEGGEDAGNGGESAGTDGPDEAQAASGPSTDSTN